ncbi:MULTISPECIES: DUF2093 domain-containing protein [unclassified Brevundimonas]|uniref:DUF2093 domain-containing protein n=1 Tax=unclassified Brevundimonas TaxID=2622653 RepID=UPI0025BEC853|nr:MULTISPECIES: DUF2093 domain-containing protein [unclassified Brevundimonas]
MDMTAADQAVLHYGDGEFAVLKPGRFVRCAVTDRPIPLEILRYWSPSRQQPYYGPAEFIAAQITVQSAAK